MSIKTQLFKMSTKFAQSKVVASRNAPTYLVAGGIVALLASTVFAAKASTELEPIIQDAELALQDLDDSDNRAYPKDQGSIMNSRIKVYMHTGMRVFRLYGVSIGLAVAGTAAILYSHGLLRRREASLLAAYGILERAYDAYRDRVRNSFGEEVEDLIYRGREVQVNDVDAKTRKITWEPTKASAPTPRSEYAVEFGRDNPNWSDARPEYNLVFLRAQETYHNNRLQAHGHVLLNDVYDSLGMPRTPAGCVVGWLKDGVDGVVDFGLFDAGSPEENDYFYFFDGEGPIYLDFNVDGEVWYKIGQPKS